MTDSRQIGIPENHRCPAFIGDGIETVTCELEPGHNDDHSQGFLCWGWYTKRYINPPDPLKTAPKVRVSDVNNLLTEPLKGRGLTPSDVACVTFYPDGYEVVYYVRDYQGGIIVDHTRDEPEAMTAVSEFSYADPHKVDA